MTQRVVLNYSRRDSLQFDLGSSCGSEELDHLLFIIGVGRFLVVTTDCIFHQDSRRGSKRACP